MGGCKFSLFRQFFFGAAALVSAVVSSQSLAAAADVQCVCVQMRVENITLGIRQCLSISCTQQKIYLLVLFTVSFLGLI